MTYCYLAMPTVTTAAGFQRSADAGAKITADRGRNAVDAALAATHVSMIRPFLELAVQNLLQ